MLRALLQIKRDLKGPISSPLLLLSCFAYPFLFRGSAVFLLAFVSLCNNFSLCLHFPCFTPTTTIYLPIYHNVRSHPFLLLFFFSFPSFQGFYRQEVHI